MRDFFYFARSLSLFACTRAALYCFHPFNWCFVPMDVLISVNCTFQSYFESIHRSIFVAYFNLYLKKKTKTKHRLKKTATDEIYSNHKTGWEMIFGIKFHGVSSLGLIKMESFSCNRISLESNVRTGANVRHDLSSVYY